MTREREAVDSEFQMALPSDDYRKEQLICSFFKSDAAINSFYWGNLLTLKDTIPDDELYKKLHAFRMRHYSANRMTLAVQARLPLDNLQNLVLKTFGGVPSNHMPPDDFSIYRNLIFDMRKFAKKYYIKFMKDLSQVK